MGSMEEYPVPNYAGPSTPRSTLRRQDFSTGKFHAKHSAATTVRVKASLMSETITKTNFKSNAPVSLVGFGAKTYIPHMSQSASQSNGSDSLTIQTQTLNSNPYRSLLLRSV